MREIVLGYFDALASSSFKDTKKGKRAFYPWGRFGKGYELQTEEQYEALRRLLVRYYLSALPFVILAAVWRNWMVLAVVFPVAILVASLVFTVMVRRMTRGLPVTDEKLTLKDSYEAQARRHSPRMLWAMLVLSLIFVAGGLGLTLGGGELLIGLITIALFTASAGVFAWMLLVRRRLLRQADPEKARVFD